MLKATFFLVSWLLLSGPAWAEIPGRYVNQDSHTALFLINGNGGSIISYCRSANENWHGICDFYIKEDEDKILYKISVYRENLPQIQGALINGLRKTVNQENKTFLSRFSFVDADKTSVDMLTAEISDESLVNRVLMTAEQNDRAETPYVRSAKRFKEVAEVFNEQLKKIDMYSDK